MDGTPGTKATLSSPSGLAFDRRSTIYIAEHGGIRKLDVSGVISTFYTSPRLPKVSVDTPPFVDTYKGIALDAAGNVYVTADTLPNDYFQKLATYSTLHRVLKFSPNADVTILVVGSDRSLQVIPTSSLIGSLGGIAIDRSGLLYVCETAFNRVFTASSTDGGPLTGEQNFVVVVPLETDFTRAWPPGTYTAEARLNTAKPGMYTARIALQIQWVR